MTTRLLERDAAVSWHPYTQHGIEAEPLAVVGAKGAWLELADGRRLIDGISSWWTILHGHGHPRLVEALHQQAQRLDHVLFAGCTHEPAVALAECLVEMASVLPARDGAALSRVFYSDDGSTAVEVALKAAYQTWLRRGQGERRVFLSLEGGYHGDTFGAMAVGDPDPFFVEFAPLLFDVVRVPPDSDALEEVFQRYGAQTVALIMEPLVQGAAGMVTYPAEVLQRARSLCDEHGTFLIADEVMTGFGRTGSVFACEQAGISPDLMCLAKGLTGGILPLSATMVSEEIYSAFLGDQRGKAFFHGHSFTANPLGCAVGLASMALVKEEDTPRRLARIGERIRSQLSGLEASPSVRQVRQLGGMVAVELEAPDGGYLAGLGERLRAACRGQDVLLRPLGNVIYALPPACVSESECDLIAQAMTRVCETATQE